MKNTQRTYQIRRKILEAMVEFDQACRSQDLIEFTGFMLVKPTLDELAEQWKALRLAEYIESYEGFDGEYCKITAAGLRQVNPEFPKQVFVWGPQALKAIILTAISAVLMLAGSGCGLAAKSIAISNSSDAFMIAPDIQNGTVTYQLVAGGGANVVLLQLPYDEGKKYPTMIGYSSRKSMWGTFSGETGTGNVSVSYVQGSNETPEQTIKILKAFVKIINPTETTTSKK